MDFEPYIVYVKLDDDNMITDVDSSAFLPDADGWVEIDRGHTQRHHHARGNYFEKPIMDDRGIKRYRAIPFVDAPAGHIIAKLFRGDVEYWIFERTQEEMDEEYASLPAPEPSTNDLLLEMAADHEYRLCLIELGVNGNDL